MLMIIEERNEDVLTFKLAGALAGAWAVEFKRCWRAATSSLKASRIVIELTEVTFVDHEGKELLSLLMKEGAQLLASDLLMKSIVEDIARDSSAA